MDDVTLSMLGFLSPNPSTRRRSSTSAPPLSLNLRPLAHGAPPSALAPATGAAARPSDELHLVVLKLGTGSLTDVNGWRTKLHGRVLGPDEGKNEIDPAKLHSPSKDSSRFCDIT
jgi:hypothetical protein